MKILITGATGFIGFGLIQKLASNSENRIIGIDSMMPSYGNTLNKVRLEHISKYSNFEFEEIDLSRPIQDIAIFQQDYDAVVHLAAWPGVRLSETRKSDYYRNNINAFGNILEAVENIRPGKFFFASSSSVYGNKGNLEPVEECQADGTNLRSFYAATKWANEIMASSFARSVNLPVVALRFFTVFGPFGRPDMAYWHFTNKLLNKEPIEIFGEDGGTRNFTGINNVVEILEELIISTSLKSNYTPLNIAHGDPIKTIDFLALLAKQLRVDKYQIIHTERPLTDVEKTWANLDKLKNLINL